MASFDLVVIGGGPGGYSAALKAASRGASVALVEAEKTGGSCVHHACIPTGILLDAALAHLRAREMDALGVFSAGPFQPGRAAARKDVLVSQVAKGVEAALRMAGVTVIAGRGSLLGPKSVAVALRDGRDDLGAGAIVLAPGSRWEPPVIPGFDPARILTADAVQALTAAPASAVVLGGGPSGDAFALEYAVYLAAAGTAVAFASPNARLLPGLDEQVVAFVRAALGDLGISVREGAFLTAAEGGLAIVHGGGRETVACEILAAPDVRRPFVEGLGLEAVGVATAEGRIVTGRDARTNVPGIFAAGDATGGEMLSSAALQAGEAAAINATGGEASCRAGRAPHLLRIVPEVAWAGLTEEQARSAGYDVCVGLADLSFSARAVSLGAKPGVVKVVAERELGEVLGVHVAGPEASEVIAAASALMQAEATVDDLAALTAWHPSATEPLVEAARRAR